jgi:hypothetical protein
MANLPRTTIVVSAPAAAVTIVTRITQIARSGCPTDAAILVAVTSASAVTTYEMLRRVGGAGIVTTTAMVGRVF